MWERSKRTFTPVLNGAMSQFFVINWNPKTHWEVITSCYHGSKIPGSSQTVVLRIWQEKKTKNGSSYFSSIFRKCKWSSPSRKVVWDPEILLLWQFSSIGIKDGHKIMIPSYLNLFFEYSSTISVYLWLSMARMETEYSLKKLGQLFQS